MRNWLARTARKIIFGSSMATPCSSQSSITRLPRRFLGGSLVAGGVGLGVWTMHELVDRNNLAQCDAAAGGIDQTKVRNYFRYMFSDAVDKVAPGVVQIRCVKDDGWYSHESSGSGFVFDEDGSIMTNAHVVQRASAVVVKLPDGTQIEGMVESLDELADVAVVKTKSKHKLQAVSVGKSSELRVGEWIIVCGSPGSLQDSVSVGVVSALGRQSAELGMVARRMSYIQTDAAINQGNSGGPVVNLQGEVVGMSSMKAAQLEGIGFAIPIDLCMEIARQLRQHGRVLRPYLGVKVVTLRAEETAELERRFGLGLKAKSGVFVAAVSPNSPASRAGLHQGDVLLEMDGSPLVEATQLHLLLGAEIGKEVCLKGVRITGRGRAAPFTVRIVTAAAPKHGP